MAKRKAISFRALTHERLRNYCEATKITMSGFLEDLIAEKMDQAGVPVPTTVKPSESSRAKAELSDDELQSIVDEHFTF